LDAIGRQKVDAAYTVHKNPGPGLLEKFNFCRHYFCPENCFNIINTIRKKYQQSAESFGRMGIVNVTPPAFFGACRWGFQFWLGQLYYQPYAAPQLHF